MRPLAMLAWRRTAASSFGRLDLTKRSCHSTLFAEKNILKSRYPDVHLSRTPYFDFLWQNYQKNNNRTALVKKMSSL